MCNDHKEIQPYVESKSIGWQTPEESDSRHVIIKQKKERNGANSAQARLLSALTSFVTFFLKAMELSSCIIILEPENPDLFEGCQTSFSSRFVNARILEFSKESMLN